MSRPRVATAIAVVALVGCLVLISTTVPAPGIVGARYRLLFEILSCAVLGTAGAFAVLQMPRRQALVLILVAGLAMPLASFAKKAPLSDDLYRYAWDGRIQSVGIDPYRYAPNDPALDRYHDPGWLWPAPQDGSAKHTLINRPAVHTIYPPVAEGYFYALHVSGLEVFHDRGLEAAGMLVALALLAVMLALLRGAAQDGLRAEPRLLAFWVFSPMPALEFVSDAHVDGLALLFSLLAFLALRRGHLDAAAAIMALAALTKLYPALLLIAVLSRDWRKAARQGAIFAGVFVAGYAPHVAIVGVKVIGYLPGYLREEQYGSGTRYLLLSIFGLHGRPATAVVLVLLAGAAVAIWRAHPAPLLAGTWLYGALFLLTTPVQPWYAVGLGALGVCVGRWEWFAVGVAAYPVYFEAVLTKHADAAGEISYGVAALFVAAVTVLRAHRATGQWPRPRLPMRTAFWARIPVRRSLFPTRP